MRMCLAIPPVIVALTGCTMTATGAPHSTPTASKASVCDAANLTGHVGQKATSALGATMLAASGAKTLRWAPPRTALTMEFRPDRLTVAYDDDMVITSVRCG